MNRRYINLLTWRFRFQLIVRARVVQWLVVLGMVCVIALAVWQSKSRRLNDAADDLALMESRCAPLRSMRAENQRMAARLDDLHSHQSLLTRLDDEQVPYRLLGLVSQGVLDCEGGIRVQTLILVRSNERISSSSQLAGAKANAKKQPPRQREITTLKLNGVADDNLTISRFVAALRDSGVFAKVDLRSSVGARVDEGRTQSFLVECTIFDGSAHRGAQPSSASVGRL